jgi:hypothetical protein
MTKHFLLLGALVFLGFASAFAEPTATSPLFVDGVEITPLVQYLAKEVVTLESSITIYNWSPAAQDFERGNTTLAQTWAKTFWLSYGSRSGSYNMFGSGLYGAVDPMATYDYGGQTGKWLMTEIQLPVGFKMIDVDGKTSDNAASPEIESILNHFQCPRPATAYNFFSGGGIAVTTKCQSLVKTIYKDILRIDGFAYQYTKTMFKDCSFLPEGFRAFVITNPYWMSPPLVHYYTAKSTANIETRTRLQTLFLQKISDSFTSDPGDTTSQNASAAKAVITNYLAAHTESQLKGSTTKCDEETCIITVQFCEPEGRCESVDLPPLPRPGGGLITKKEAAKTSYGKLLWPDLEGKPKTSTIKNWMKENIYSCSGNLPFKRK